jgi:hypothetical protein
LELRLHIRVRPQTLQHLHPTRLCRYPIQRNHIVAVQHKLRLVPDFDQLVFKGGDVVNHAVSDALEGLQLRKTGLFPLGLWLFARLTQQVLPHPQVELLAQEAFGVLAQKVVHLALTLEDSERLLQDLFGGHGVSVAGQAQRVADGAADVVDIGLPSLLGVVNREDDGAILLALLIGVDEFALLVGAFMLQLRDIEVEAKAVHFHRHALEEAVGFDIVEAGGLPKQHHILLVGVDLLVDALVVGGEEEADGAAFGEVASEEGVEFVEQLFAEVGEVFEGVVYGLFAGVAPSLFRSSAP